MSNQIRFQVHSNLEVEENLFENITFTARYTENSVGTLLEMLDLVSEIFPSLQREDDYDIALENSMEDEQPIQRQNNIDVNITSQCYDTTDKKFTSCVICSDNYENTDIVSVLQCCHIFHTNCITEWCHYNPACPLCKSKIP